MALTNEQLTILATELRNDPKKRGYAALMDAQEYTAIAALLNDRPMVDNLEEQPAVWKLISWDEFLEALDPADVLVVYSYGRLSDDIQSALSANNRTILGAYWRGLKTVLSAESVAAVQAEMQETEPDPNWSATVLGKSRAMTLELPRVAGADVQRVDVGSIGA